MLVSRAACGMTTALISQRLCLRGKRACRSHPHAFTSRYMHFLSHQRLYSSSRQFCPVLIRTITKPRERPSGDSHAFTESSFDELDVSGFGCRARSQSKGKRHRACRPNTCAWLAHWHTHSRVLTRKHTRNVVFTAAILSCSRTSILAHT